MTFIRLQESAFTQWEELLSLRKDCDEIKIRYLAHEKDDTDESLGTSNSLHQAHHSHGTNDSGELWPPVTSPSSSETTKCSPVTNNNHYCPSTSSTPSSPSSSSSASVMIKQEMETASDRAHTSSSTNSGLGLPNPSESDYPIEMTLDKTGSPAATSSEHATSGYFPRSNSADLKDGAFLGNSSAIWKVPLNNETDGDTFGLSSTGPLETPSDSGRDLSRSPNELHYSTLESKENCRKWSPSSVANPPPSSNGGAISIFSPKVTNYSPHSSFSSGKQIRRNFYSPNGWLGSESSESQASSENCFEMVQEGFENCSSASNNTNNNPLNAGSEAPFSENFNNSSYPYSYVSMGSHHLIASSASVIHKSPPYQQSVRQSIPYHVNSQLSFMGREFMSSSSMLPDHGSNISN